MSTESFTTYNIAGSRESLYRRARAEAAAIDAQFEAEKHGSPNLYDYYANGKHFVVTNTFSGSGINETLTWDEFSNHVFARILLIDNIEGITAALGFAKSLNELHEIAHCEVVQRLRTPSTRIDDMEALCCARDREEALDKLIPRLLEAIRAQGYVVASIIKRQNSPIRRVFSALGRFFSALGGHP